MSPFLFIIVAKGLHMLHTYVEEGIFAGYNVGNQSTF